VEPAALPSVCRWHREEQIKPLARAARPPVLKAVPRVITRHRLGQAVLESEQADNGAVTLIQCFGSAA
jgi:hypothetical protein